MRRVAASKTGWFWYPGITREADRLGPIYSKLPKGMGPEHPRTLGLPKILSRPCPVRQVSEERQASSCCRQCLVLLTSNSNVFIMFCAQGSAIIFHNKASNTGQRLTFSLQRYLRLLFFPSQHFESCFSFCFSAWLEWHVSEVWFCFPWGGRALLALT